ncbi:MAG: hypothetical protein P0Y56_16250 [Candidatus Andeanibacterium colombiense]|uniref:Uncharacterized protein n=1 Tax=Candidatus Andeanibacterium colombiense TaxID=3121345 RepID=A0AAJ6BPD8_9SPHN|nr:MAG: hypothetical protein P0Y56_16250 [Sphingomonadaceae bacterium]
MSSRPLFPILAIAAIALAGLILGLTGETWEDWLADAALAFCLIPIAWAALRR